MEARAEKDREIQLYLAYRRDCERTQTAPSGVQDVVVSLPTVKFKMRRPTRLVGDDRRTGNNRKTDWWRSTEMERLITVDWMSN
jgi:hypothetical protein